MICSQRAIICNRSGKVQVDSKIVIPIYKDWTQISLLIRMLDDLVLLR